MSITNNFTNTGINRCIILSAGYISKYYSRCSEAYKENEDCGDFVHIIKFYKKCQEKISEFDEEEVNKDVSGEIKITSIKSFMVVLIVGLTLII